MWDSRSSQQFGWQNLFMINAKEADVAQKLKSSVWGDDANGLQLASLLHSHASGFRSVSGASGSDAAHVSSLSSKSTSVDSSSLGKTSMINPLQESPTASIQRGVIEVKNASVSSALIEASVGCVEPVIGLKLGKRTYFEDLCNVNNVKASSVSDKLVSSESTKRSRSSCQTNLNIRCQVEGCNLDLSAAREYNRKHRICVSHSKCPRVIVGGLERRFCQQCSRFHSLSEFDEKKRSCRKRLSDHNARRRKPRAEANQFSLVGSQQVSLAFNSLPYYQTRPTTSPIWESSESRFTLTREYAPLAQKRDSASDQPQYLLSSGIQNNSRMLSHDYYDGLASKCTLPPPKVLTEAVGQCTRPTNSVAAQDFCSALSLLSSNAWVSCNSDPISVDHSNQLNNNMQLSISHTVMESLPAASLELWKTEQQSSDSLTHHLSSESNESYHLQEFKLFSDPFISSFETHQLH